MRKIKLINLIILFCLLISCGYSPIYKDLSNVNFSIDINEISGNRKINNQIKSKLINYKSSNSEKNYSVNISTEYEKNIIAKDTTGAATEYKLVIYSTFKVSSVNYENEFSFKESFNMKSISDKLEELDYEENIQSNLINIITRKLILKLSQIK